MDDLLEHGLGVAKAKGVPVREQKGVWGEKWKPVESEREPNEPQRGAVPRRKFSNCAFRFTRGRNPVGILVWCYWLKNQQFPL